MLELGCRAETFTGQASQRVGMWDDLRQSAAAGKIFQMTDEIVDFPLSKLCSQGPLEQITRTSNAQPAIVAHSLAALAAARELHPELFEENPQYVLGHSVGEYSALAAAGVITTEDAIYLVRQRGLLMEQYSPAGKMAALLGFSDKEQVIGICRETGAEAVNFNGPSQIVISGGTIEVEDAVRKARENKIKVVLLEALHPFHSSKMKPVQDMFREKVAPLEFKDSLRVVLNTTAQFSRSGAEIKENAVVQIASPVLWEASMRLVIAKGVTTILEFGPGPVLTKLLRSIDPGVRGICIKDYESAQQLSL